MAYVPKHGDAVWLNFDPQSGRERAGRRPALVLSPSAYNDRVGLLIACPITSRAKGYSFEVKIPEGLLITGVVLADHVKSLDWTTREIKFICRLPDVMVDHVLEKLTVLLTSRS